MQRILCINIGYVLKLIALTEMRKSIYLILALIAVGCTQTGELRDISLNSEDKRLIKNNNVSHSIIQPGAPGQNSKTLDPIEATKIASTSYIQPDVDFLKGMITHHQQAILMSELAEERTNNKTILDPLFQEHPHLQKFSHQVYLR